MRIKLLTSALLLSAVFVQPALAGDEHQTTMAADEHGSQIFHAFRLETDYGSGEHGPVASWDLDGWIGGDYNKFAVKSEGEIEDGTTEQLEYWGMYSRNISTFWDFQAGVRHDTQPVSTTYAVLGFEGLAPQFFETEAHLFVSDEGDVTARIRQENDFLLT